MQQTECQILRPLYNSNYSTVTIVNAFEGGVCGAAINLSEQYTRLVCIPNKPPHYLLPSPPLRKVQLCQQIPVIAEEIVSTDDAR